MSLYQNLKKKLKINNYYIPVGATTRIGHGAQTKGHDPGSVFSSLLRLEMTFSHSTLGAALLYDEEASEWEKKWHPMKSACSLEVKQLKKGVFQLKDLPDKAQNI